LMLNNYFILKFFISLQFFLGELSTKLHLNLKTSTCYSSPMFCANILLHNIGFDPISFLVGNMALTTGIPSSIEK